MATLTWNEIRLRASTFCEEWIKRAPTAREEADAQDFQTDFLEVFGVPRRQVSYFEHRVNMGTQTDSSGKKKARRGYIDLFWKGVIMTEMKSPGKDKAEAYKQAKEYADNLPPEQLPRGIIISDFLSFDYYDMDKGGEKVSFKLEELPQKVELFSYLAGYKEITYQPVSEVDIKAAEMMGELHDALKDNNYTGHQLEMYLVRLMFCLFADDSGIFDEKGVFYNYIVNKTKEDGSDLALHIGLIFDILNKPEDKRQKNLDVDLLKFKYIDGGLFEERLETAAFNSEMRKTLLKCCTLDWSKIKPEIFGAMFQSVNSKEKRRALGEHYTSEANILKVVKTLFLDDLWEEFEKIRKLSKTLRRQRLLEFHTKLQQLKFLDPACGCGNFLIVTYRELRILEIEVLDLYLESQQLLDIELYIRVNVDQFYGIEIEEFPARIAQTAMWLIDHLMNTIASVRFGRYIARIPLTTSPSIIIGNALTTDWENIVSKNELSYILGNPPFVGARIMKENERQKSEVNKVFANLKNNGNLDYVCCWYKIAAQYIQGTNIEVAFVSTNSICQGEQVPILWSDLIEKHGIKINFAHQTFKWSNEAKGKAAVFCIIVGFSLNDRKTKKIFQYSSVTSDPLETIASQINAYLIDAPIIFIQKRSTPLSNVSEMNFGSMANDGGHLLLTAEERNQIIEKEPYLDEIIRPFLGADEFINNIPRYCIWLKDVSPSKYQKSKAIMDRINKVKKHRQSSSRGATNKLADFPSLFGEIRQPDTEYLLVPKTSSENRRYIPIGFVDKLIISSDATLLVPNATLYEFGIITSAMHMAWMRYVCGRLKSDYRYSASIVYNNYPWPKPSEKQKKDIETAAQGVLDVRKKHPGLSYASLYDNNTMIPELVKAHQKLDKAVDTAYGKTFNSDSERVAHLFYLYQELTEGLITEAKKKKGKK